jgi:hypothetical protein
MTLRIHATDADAGDGDVGGVVQISFGADWKAAAEHSAVAGGGTDGVYQRVGLQAADPNGIKAFVKDPKWRKKPADRDRDVRVGNVVELSVVKVLVDRPAVGTAVRRTLKLAFKLRPRLD